MTPATRLTSQREAQRAGQWWHQTIKQALMRGASSWGGD